jgi:general secretion pathway protein A
MCGVDHLPVIFESLNSIAAPARALPMYEAVYGFAQPPFALTPDPRFLYRSESHDHALTALLQALRRNEGFIVLTGDIGTGKTTLCRALLEQVGPTTFTSLVLNPLLTIDELLRSVLLDFGVVSSEAVRSGRLGDTTTQQLIGTLQDFLRSLAPLGANAVIVIDEAQHLAPAVLEQIRIISGLEPNGSKRLQVLLVGQLNLLDVLGDAGMRQLDQRISLRARLEPLDREALEAYVNWRLTVARSSTSVAFESAALDLVQFISGGVPRVINLLCDKALAAAAVSTATDITPSHVRVAAEELGLAAPATGRSRQTQLRTAALLLAVIAIIAAAVLLLVSPDRLIDAGRAAVAAAPAKTLAVPVAAYDPPTEDLLLPPPVQAPTVRRAPARPLTAARDSLLPADQ